ncbi:protein quick-to-court isoform X2 [Atheta coriaria]|uniref:protein quick-to-court isoform X2 n=1 Tax=Dalotia coriaria TaxID=877792 RepID=UPI0031F3A152
MAEAKSTTSRIPVASPLMLRRSWSVRVKGDRTDAGREVALRRQHSFTAAAPGSTRPERADDGGTTTGARRNAAPMGAHAPNGLSHRTRSLSLNLSNTTSSRLALPQATSAMSSPRTPPTSPSEYARSQQRSRATDWDAESITSGISGISMASSSCDHASVARNGTTFSGRSMKYVFHCSQHAGQTGEDYLTPTQRAQRQVRRLKTLLQQAQRDLDSRDSDIVKLTKEVVELRLYKAALSSPEERSNSSDAITVKENQLDELGTDTPDGNPATNSEMTSSYTDSGHYDDYTNSSVHSKDSMLCDEFNGSPFKKTKNEMVDKATVANMLLRDLECEHQELMSEYEKRIQNLVKAHETESQEARQKHNDKVDELLQRIAEINKKYWEIVPEFENAKERIHELEVQLEEALKKLEEQEEKHKKSYLQVYAQGKEAERLDHENKVMDLAVVNQAPSRISVPELLQQLQVTQAELENIRAMYKQVMEAKHKKIDPEITLQFLKSAIYYFLTDKENSQGHLRAIQSILGFTPSEIANIEKARTT